MEPVATKIQFKKPQQDPLDPACVLTFSDLDIVGRLLKKHITDKESLLQAIAATATVSVEGVAVVLEPRLLQRLKSRCLDKPNWPKWLAETCVRQLHDFAGY